MEAFVLNAAKPRENLDSFNQRLRAYCLENPVVAVDAHSIGPTLVVSLTHADDIDLPAGNTVLVAAIDIDALDDELEEHIGEVIDALAEEDQPDDARVPFQVQVIPRRDLPNQGWALVSCVTGSIDFDGDEG